MTDASRAFSDLLETNALLSDNTQVTTLPLSSSEVTDVNGIAPSALPSISCGPWHLSVESYQAPISLGAASISSNITFITIPTPVAAPLPLWTRIPGLERVGGVAIYRTAFTLPA